MNTKQIRQIVAGIFLGMALAAAVTSGFFNEADQYKEAQTGWCAESCK